MRTTHPSEYETKGIVQILTERRSSQEEEKKEEESEILPVKEETQDERVTKMLEKIPLVTTLPKFNINEEEIAEKIKVATNEFKDLIISGAKIAKQKIKQTREIAEEKQVNRDSEKYQKWVICLFSLQVLLMIFYPTSKQGHMKNKKRYTQDS